MNKLLFFCLLSLPVLSLGSCKQNSSAAEESLKVISYNIRYGKANDGENSWDNRKAATIEMLKDKQPDVFGVQEAYYFQIDYITENCPQYKSFGIGRECNPHDSNVSLEKRGEHMSIFYNTRKVEFIDGGTYWLSETPDVCSKGWDAQCKRTATWTLLKLKDSGKKFFYVNTHLDHVGKIAQKNGLALIVDKIASMNPEGLPMILTGDFNVFPDDEVLTDLNKIMLNARDNAVDSDNTASFNGWGTSEKIIDYIYYSGFKSCQNFKVISRQYAGVPFISDHYPIIANLIF